MTKHELELVFASALGTLLVVVALIGIIYYLDQDQPVAQPVADWERQLDAQSTPSATPLQEASPSATIE